MFNKTKNVVSTGIAAAIMMSAASIVTVSPVQAAESQCKPEWEKCVCVYLPFNKGKSCINDVGYTSHSGNGHESNTGNGKVIFKKRATRG